MADSRLAEAFLSLLLRIRWAGWSVMLTGRRTATGYSLAGSDTGYVWVRSTHDSWEQTQVRGDAQKVNVPVWVGPNADGQLQIMDIKRDMAAFSLGGGAAGAILPGILPESVAQMVFEANQLRPGRVRLSPQGGLYVYVEPFFYPGGWWPGGDVLLTVPAAAGMQSWVGIALDTATGTMGQLNGADYPLTVQMGPDELSQIAAPEGYIPLEALVLKYGQSVITGAEQWENWRISYSEGGSAVLGFVSRVPGSSSRNVVQPTGDYKPLVLKGSAGQAANLLEWQTSAGAILAFLSALGGLVINEQGNDADTRIEGDTDPNLLFLDASTDRVGIGTASPATKLDVNGVVTTDGASLDGATVVNESGADVDFRVEGDTATHALFVDASQDAVGVNQASVAASAVFEAASTTKGVLIPRMNTTQRDAIGSPATGLLIYNTSTSTFQFYSGSSWVNVGDGAASITVREADGIPNVAGVSTVVVSNGTLIDDGSGQVTILTGGGGSGSAPYSLCQGRLTLSTGVPVTTSDVTAAGTLYFTPYKGNQVGLYAGAAWLIHALSELSISLSGLLPHSIHDVFLDYNGGTPVLALNAWTAGATGSITGATNATPISITSTAHGLSTNDIVTISGVGGNTAANGTFQVTNTGANTFTLQTLAAANVAGSGAYTSGGNWYKSNYTGSRATALTTQDGVYVLTGATDWRYLGTIRIAGTAGQAEDSLTKRFVWNCYNHIPRPFYYLDATSHTYGTTSYRSWNNATAHRVEFVVGDTWFARMHLAASMRGGTIAYASIGVDNTVTNALLGVQNPTTTNEYYSNEKAVAVDAGYHYFQVIEYGSGTCTYIACIVGGEV